VKNIKLYVIGAVILGVALLMMVLSLGGPKNKVVGTWESCALFGCTTWVFERDGDIRGIGIDTVTGQYQVIDKDHIAITWDPGVLGGPRGECEVEKSGGLLILTCPDRAWSFERK